MAYDFIFEIKIAEFLRENNETPKKRGGIETAVKKAEKELESKNKDTTAKIYHVPSSSLPHGKNSRVLGLYDPNDHSIYIANDLPPHVEKFVYYHEVAHSLGIIDEREADKYATKKCGYYLNLREPVGFSVN